MSDELLGKEVDRVYISERDLLLMEPVIIHLLRKGFFTLAGFPELEGSKVLSTWYEPDRCRHVIVGHEGVKTKTKMKRSKVIGLIGWVFAVFMSLVAMIANILEPDWADATIALSFVVFFLAMALDYWRVNRR